MRFEFKDKLFGIGRWWKELSLWKKVLIAVLSLVVIGRFVDDADNGVVKNGWRYHYNRFPDGDRGYSILVTKTHDKKPICLGLFVSQGIVTLRTEREEFGDEWKWHDGELGGTFTWTDDESRRNFKNRLIILIEPKTLKELSSFIDGKMTEDQ